jgi:hypothetical protein
MNQNMLKITFITGCSGAGKSTIVGELQHQIKDEQIIFLHFDSIGVPIAEEMIRDYGSPRGWQEQTTYIWVSDIISKYSHYSHAIIEGQVNIDFILGAFKKFNVTSYNILLIHANDEVRHKRLRVDRFQPELVNEDMDNWARFLYNQARQYNTPIIYTSVDSLEKTIFNLRTIIRI